MLGKGTVVPTIAVKDLAAAKKYYSETLGLKQKDENEGGVTYACGGSSRLFVYQSPTAGTGEATCAAFEVESVEDTVAELKKNGVTFEHYEFPGSKLEGDIHVMGPFKAAWFKDPDGNILSVDNKM